MLDTQCSYHKCDRVPAYNVQAVEQFAEAHGLPNSQFHCYYDMDDVSFAILDIVTVATVIHCMFWPTIALVTGLAIVFVFIFYLDTEQIDSRMPQLSSLERRLVHVADHRNTTLAGDRNTILTSEQTDRD